MAGTGVLTRLRARLRKVNKYVLNPVMRLVAGRRHGYAAALRHVGRRSGRPYTTPVGAEPIPDGFVIPLAYGTDVDWLRNLQSAGQATIAFHGHDYLIDEPQVIAAADALPMVRERQQRLWRRMGIEHYVRIRAIAR